MIKTITKPALYLAQSALLAACGGVPASNEMQLDIDGGGRFSGSAGGDWTVVEIRTHTVRQVCGHGPVEEFNTYVLPSAPEYTIFSGSCATGEYGAAFAGLGQNNIITTSAAAPTVEVQTPVSPSEWDGSTPFID